MALTGKLVTYPSINEWKAARITGIGGRDIGSLMGHNKYRCAMRIACEKLERIPEPVVTSEKAYWGNVFEAPIAEAFGELEKRTVVLVAKNTSYVDTDSPWIRCSLDALQTQTVGDQDDTAPLDIKTVTPYLREHWLENRVPEDVYDQIQWQCMILGATWCSAVALIDREMFPRDFKADAKHQAAMLATAKAFWAFIERGELPPDLIDGSEDCCKLIGETHPAAEQGKTIELPPGADGIDQNIGICDAKIKEAKEERDGLKNMLRDMIGDAEVGRLPSGTAGWSFKTVKRKAFSVKASEGRQLRRIK